MAYRQADKLLEKKKEEWKAGGVGGVHLLSAQVAKELTEVPTLVAQLQTGSANAKAEAAAELRSLAVNGDNQVAIAKVEGALAALVALLSEGSAVGKEKAAGAVKSLSMNTGIKSSLLQLGCPANALA